MSKFPHLTRICSVFILTLPSFSKMATVRVGKIGLAMDYSTPAALPCNHSVFFKNALKEWWKEGENRIVTLAADDPEIFALYLHILYGEKLSLKSFPVGDPAAYRDPAQIKVDRLTVCQVFGLAEFLQDTRCKNAVVDSLFATLHPYPRLLPGNWDCPFLPNAEAVAMIYAGTEADAPIRKLLVDMYASTEGSLQGHIGPKRERKVSKSPDEFLADLLELLLRRQKLEPPTPSKEDYHESL
jgi:hypothetical protein